MKKTQTAVCQVEPLRGSFEAYRIGLNIQKFHGWVNLVDLFIDKFARPHSPWGFPLSAINNAVNYHLRDKFITRIGHSLRMLAKYRVVDSVALVEMHSVCDRLNKDFAEFVQCRKCRNVKGVAKHYKSIKHLQRFLDEAGNELTVGKGESLQDWYHIGTLLGKAWCLHALNNKRAAVPAVMSEFIELGRKLLPKDNSDFDTVVRLWDPGARYSGIPKREEPVGMLITAISNLDNWVCRYLRTPTTLAPYLVFNDKNETFTYFGTKIAFDDFPTKACDLLRVFSQRPEKPIGAKELLKLSHSEADINQLPSYLARLRDAINERIEIAPLDLSSEYGLDLNATELCFIIVHRRARARTANTETVYKLALPTSRVRYIG